MTLRPLDTGGACTNVTLKARRHTEDRNGQAGHARIPACDQRTERSMMTACIQIGGAPLVHPPEHPCPGEVIEFPVSVPGCYSLEFRAAPYFMRYHVDIAEDGRARLRLVEQSLPDDFGLTELERGLLDGLARIIACDMLRRREVA